MFKQNGIEYSGSLYSVILSTFGAEVKHIKYSYSQNSTSQLPFYEIDPM